jgi:hypothetical protein
MRDGLVAGDGEGALQGAGGADDLGGHAVISVTRGRSRSARGGVMNGAPLVLLWRNPKPVFAP